MTLVSCSYSNQGALLVFQFNQAENRQQEYSHMHVPKLASARKDVHLLVLILLCMEIQASELSDGCVKQEENLG